MFAVAGASGHVGSAVARGLLAMGKKVKLLVRDAAKGAAWQERGAEVAVVRLDDRAGLAGALRGTEGAFLLLPPNFAAPDMRAYQKSVGEIIAGAVRDSGVRHVALLSSVGAELSEKSGPILGLHWLEDGLRGSGAILTAARAGYFQENVLGMLEPARKQGIYPTFTPKDFEMPMIATRDIGEEIARILATGASKHNVVDIHGPAYSAVRIAAIVGKLLGRTLQIVEVPPEGHVAAMVQAGFPSNVAEMFAELNAAAAAGRLRPVGDRLVQGKTTLEETLRGYL